MKFESSASFLLIVLSIVVSLFVWQVSHGVAFIAPAVAVPLVVALSLSMPNLRNLSLVCLGMQVAAMLAIAFVP